MPNALVQKTYIPIDESGRPALTRKFRTESLIPRKIEIDGFNVFTAVVDPALRNALGVEDERPFELSRTGWKNLWETAGIPSPGEMPAGCMAIVSFACEPRVNQHGRVEIERIERYSGSTVVVALGHGRETNVSGGAAQDGFLVALLPKVSEWTFSLEYCDDFASPTLVTDHLKGGAVQSAAPQALPAFMESAKQAAEPDTSPQALGDALLVEHGNYLLAPEASQKCFDLVNAGADLTLRDNYDHTILMKAVRYGHAGLVKALLAKGADIDARAGSAGADAESMAQAAADNARYRTMPAHMPEVFKKYSSIVQMIQDERAARLGAAQPQPEAPEPYAPIAQWIQNERASQTGAAPPEAAPEQDSAPAETTELRITVFKPLVFKKFAGAQL